jgi:hypothetical protein
VAVGLLDEDLARAIVFDYALARELRPGAHGFPFMHRPEPTPVTQPDTPVVALLFDGDAQADGSLPYAVLAADHAEIAVIYRGTSDWSVVAKRHPNPGPNFPQQMPMADDAGTIRPSMFQGGGGNGEWIGRFATDQPLSRTTSWLELGGRRLTLVPRKSDLSVRVEELPGASPAAHFLHHRLASTDGLPPPEIDPVIDALVATGAIAGDDPVLDEVQRVWAAGPGVTGRIPPNVRQAMLRQAGAMPGMSAPAWNAADLPLPWSRYDPERDVVGPTGIVPIGAATPVVEGAAAVFYALNSEPDGFSVDTEQYGSGPSHHFAAYAVERAPGFAWWAEDDLGNLYRGSWNGSSGRENSMRGNISYLPALDPNAKTLRLLATVRAHRVVVELSLPNWRAGS